MNEYEKQRALILGMKAVDRGMDFAIQAINDVKVMIKVFIETMEKHADKEEG